jgi:formate hydrogenlyase subunit 6/NADH:ubiquinone oxidoreductase subunit I
LNVLQIGTETNRRMIHYVSVANPLSCLGCDYCERICPTAAIFVAEVNSEQEALA